MKVLVLWPNGTPISSQKYNFIFTHFVELGYDNEVLIKRIKHGTLSELHKRFMLLELKGEKENIAQFVQALKSEHYELYEEVQG